MRSGRSLTVVSATFKAEQGHILKGHDRDLMYVSPKYMAMPKV